jgi:hypothetical protein
VNQPVYVLAQDRVKARKSPPFQVVYDQVLVDRLGFSWPRLTLFSNFAESKCRMVGYHPDVKAESPVSVRHFVTPLVPIPT